MPNALPFVASGLLSEASTSISAHPPTTSLSELVSDEISGNSAWNLPCSQFRANLSHEESQWSWRSRKAVRFLTRIGKERFLRSIHRKCIQSTINRLPHCSFWNPVKVLVIGTKGSQFPWTWSQWDGCISFRVQSRRFSLILLWKWGYCGVLNLCARILVDEGNWYLWVCFWWYPKKRRQNTLASASLRPFLLSSVRYLMYLLRS